MKKCICLILLLGLTVTLLAGCGGKNGPEPLDVPQADNIAGKEVDVAFKNAYMQLAVELLQKAAEEKREDNLLISPLSMQIALTMTANGADGQTLQEMESVLGQNIALEDLNEYLYDYLYDRETGVSRVGSEELKIANSIWFRDQKDSFRVTEDFLQSMANYYVADIYKCPFDNKTVDDINAWVNAKTDGMIPDILEKIDSDSMMYLINAIAFDAQWDEPYDENAIREGSFTTYEDKEQTVDMMHGEESVYLEDNRATGFLKPYEGGRFVFAVLMPNEGTDLYGYLQTLTSESLSQTLAEAQNCKVFTEMPKFSYDFELSMNDALMEMGMPTAFDPDAADLSKLGASSQGNLYIGNVLHKTFIRVDGLGTQAGAVTMVEIPAEGAMEPESYKEVIVDRPFVYMILDAENKLPIFLGCVTEVTE